MIMRTLMLPMTWILLHGINNQFGSGTLSPRPTAILSVQLRSVGSEYLSSHC